MINLSQIIHKNVGELEVCFCISSDIVIALYCIEVCWVGSMVEVCNTLGVHVLVYKPIDCKSLADDTL